MAFQNALSSAIALRVARELRLLHNPPPQDGSVQVSDMCSLTDIYAEMAGPAHTPYEGGTFRLKLALGYGYPSVPPQGFFLTKIFHPNVALSGEICVNTWKRDWTPNTTLSHLVQVIRCLLIAPFPDPFLNNDAGKLFLERYDEYVRKAMQWTTDYAIQDNTAGLGAAIVQVDPESDAGTLFQWMDSIKAETGDTGGPMTPSQCRANDNGSTFMRQKRSRGWEMGDQIPAGPPPASLPIVEVNW